MFTFALMVGIIWIVWKLCLLGIRLTWGITKFVLSIFVFPLVVIGLVIAGLFYLAIPILVIVGVVAIIGSATNTAS